MSFPFIQQTRSFSDINVSKEPEVFLRALNKFSNDVSFAVNSRTIGTYSGQTSATGNIFIGVATSRIILSVSSILNGITTIASNIPTSSKLFLCNLYGIASNGTTVVPIPYVNIAVPTDGISLNFDIPTGIVSIITSTANWTGYSANIIVEYGYGV